MFLRFSSGWSARFLVVPTLLFLGFMAFFILIEYERFSNNEGIYEAIEDPALPLMLQLERGIWKIPFCPKGGMDPKLFRDSLHNVESSVVLLSQHFLENNVEKKVHLTEVNRLETVEASLEGIKSFVEKNGLTGEDNLRKIETKINVLRESAHNLSSVVSTSRETKGKELLENISQRERYHALLAVLVLLCGALLIIVLFEMVQHYKKNAERAKAAERVNALFAAALQSTRVGVLIRDMRKKSEHVTFVNDAFVDMTGYNLSEIPDNDSAFLFGWKTDPDTVTAFRRAISLRENATFDLMVYRKDGSPFWSEWHLSPILGPEGEIAYFVSLFNDMTAFRQTQEDLIQAKKTAERASAIKTNFLAMMSHEIRTPINGIQGVLKLIDEMPLDAEQKHLLGIAITSSKALHRIINDILDYAKMEAGKVEIFPEPFRLQTLFDEVVGLAQPMMEKKNLELEVDVDANLPACFVGDMGRLHQILLNLVSNAIKFTDSGFIRLRVLSLLEQEVRGKAGLLVRFEVQDSGMGIATSEQGQLFKEFSQIDHSHTRRFGGTGLGLAICKRLIDLLEGEIGVESQVGKGSKFWFMLPLELCEGEAGLVKEENSEIKGPKFDGRSPQNCSVLLVEDNDTNRLVAGRYLQKAGFKVEEACNGLQAVEKAKEKNYDLILMDVSMPEMDGMLATCHIRAEGGHNAKVPIIALTAHVMAGDRELCLEVGMNDYLNKPIEYSALLKALERWLHVSLIEGASSHVSTKAVVVDTLPDFDTKQLERMKTDLGAPALRQIVETFLKDSSSRVLTLSDPALDVVRESAHTLKSSSANCGLVKFGQIMAEMEYAASKGYKDQVASLLEPALALYEKGIVTLRKQFETLVD